MRTHTHMCVFTYLAHVCACVSFSRSGFSRRYHNFGSPRVCVQRLKPPKHCLLTDKVYLLTVNASGCHHQERGATLCRKNAQSRACKRVNYSAIITIFQAKQVSQN